MTESIIGTFPDWNLSGRVALVIGGARHLGNDMASALAAAGARVALTSRQGHAAETAALKLVHEHGVEAIGIELDACDSRSIEAAVSAVRARYGRLDVLINNAGGGSGGSVGDFFARPVEDIRRMIDTNLLSTILCSQAFGQLIAQCETEHGSVVNIASVAGIVGRDRRMYEAAGIEQQPVDYAAAKAGVIGFTRDLAAYMGPLGIRVNSISPGGFGPRDLPPAFVEEYSARTPLGRMGRDGLDLKGAAVFLASDASAYLTGHNLVVDGGFSTWR